MRIRPALLLTCAILIPTGIVLAQTTPPGLVRQGNVVMMQPISDTQSDAEKGPPASSELRPSSARSLSAADHDIYTRAFAAADRGDWTGARGLAAQGHDATARRIVEWRYVTDRNSGASFGEINAFIKANSGWPFRDSMFARAEKAMDPAMDPRAVVAWFAGRDPVTALGKVRLGQALVAVGDASKGREIIKDAWITGNFEPADELNIAQRYGDVLTPEVERQRMDQLLWRGDTTAAKRELSRLSSADADLARARIALQTGLGNGLTLADQLSGAQRNDPGLIFDRARALRRAGSIDAVAPLLERAPTREMARINPSKWWSELSLAIRQCIKDSNYRSAYALAANSGLTAGTEYAEVQFLAGWLALRFLKDPNRALPHFKKLEDGVSRPISLSRARYWQGRAAEAAGDLASAYGYYKSASQFSDTFYGQLAAARIDATPTIKLKEPWVDPSGVRDEFNRDDLTRAIRVLADIGAESLVRTFAMKAADSYPDPKRIKLLNELLVQLGFREVAVRVAKNASYDGNAMYTYLHPVIPLPAYNGPDPRPEQALVFGIIRQETEFDPDAVSGAGARGIMQLMPYTAKKIANYTKVPYRPNDLARDVNYNIQLGMGELSMNLNDWGGSFVLTAAGYNAGPGNVRKWLDQYGDPRSPTTDPVDWIELIPFNETRNYVQRVLENTQVYRARLSGKEEPLRIMADVYRPRLPDQKPLAYTPPPQGVVPPDQVPTPTQRPDH